MHKADYRDLFIMDERDISGAGLAFAVGAAMANPGSRAVLVCDKTALFHHLREIQPIVSMGLEIAIICIDDTDRETNVVDLTAVLEGLGCRAEMFDSASSSVDRFLAQRPGRPHALIVQHPSPGRSAARPRAF
jgi:hypothetical protein